MLSCPHAEDLGAVGMSLKNAKFMQGESKTDMEPGLKMVKEVKQNFRLCTMPDGTPGSFPESPD